MVKNLVVEKGEVDEKFMRFKNAVKNVDRRIKIKIMDDYGLTENDGVVHIRKGWFFGQAVSMELYGLLTGNVNIIVFNDKSIDLADLVAGVLEKNKLAKATIIMAYK